MSPTKFVAAAAIACAMLTTSTASSWGPERRKQATPISAETLVEVLRDSHVAEYGKAPPRNRLAMAWAQVALENGRGAAVWNFNLGNVGPSRYTNVPWYFHSPGARYRAFDDLQESGRAYWRVVHRCSSALRAFDDGAPQVAAGALKRCGYYGAALAPYVVGLRSLFNQARVEVVPAAERRQRRIREEEREKSEDEELQRRFPLTPACACSRWN